MLRIARGLLLTATAAASAEAAKTEVSAASTMPARPAVSEKQP